MTNDNLFRKTFSNEYLCVSCEKVIFFFKDLCLDAGGNMNVFF